MMSGACVQQTQPLRFIDRELFPYLVKVTKLFAAHIDADPRDVVLSRSTLPYPILPCACHCACPPLLPLRGTLHESIGATEEGQLSIKHRGKRPRAPIYLSTFAPIYLSTCAPGCHFTLPHVTRASRTTRLVSTLPVLCLVQHPTCADLGCGLGVAWCGLASCIVDFL